MSSYYRELKIFGFIKMCHGSHWKKLCCKGVLLRDKALLEYLYIYVNTYIYMPLKSFIVTLVKWISIALQWPIIVFDQVI